MGGNLSMAHFNRWTIDGKRRTYGDVVEHFADSETNKLFPWLIFQSSRPNNNNGIGYLQYNTEAVENHLILHQNGWA